MSADGATLDRTLIAGRPGPGGYRRIAVAPGEPHLVRHDLGGTAPGGTLQALAVIAQLSDLHLTDPTSPARAEFLDRFGDEDSPYAAALGRVGVYRPQESLTLQVAGQMVAALSRMNGPVTGRAIDLALSTGDAIDNSQANELFAYLGVLSGATKLTTASGGEHFEGVGSPWHYDVRYWHPDGTPSGEPDDLPRSQRGFPLVPGLLSAARLEVASDGLEPPWFAVYGNHDALLGGTLPPSPELEAVVVGGRKPIGFIGEFDPLALLVDNQSRPSPGLWGITAAETREVAPDAGRHFVGAREYLVAHLASGGHGLDEGSAAGGRAYYAFDQGPLRMIVLDTVNRAGGWQGSLDPEQFAWLEDELISCHATHLDNKGRRVDGRGPDRLVVLASHHPLETLINDYAPNGEHRVLAGAVRDLLSRFGNVVAWLAGHTHTNTITPLKSAAGGCWLVTTASHIDWPQQARLVEIAVEPASRNVVVTTTMVDHDGLVDPRTGELDDAATLAGWSRELAANAWQQPPGSPVPVGAGGRADRNTMLLWPAPFDLDAPW